MILDVDSVVEDLERQNVRDLAFLTLLAGMGDDLPDAIRRLRNAAAAAREWGHSIDRRRQRRSGQLADRVDEIGGRAAHALQGLADRRRGEDGIPRSADQVLVFTVEIPTIYTDDLDELRAETGEHFDSESEFLLSCIGEPSVVRLRTESMGEKDSSVQEVWGSIRGVRLADPSPGITEEWLAENGHRLMSDDENACEHCAIGEQR